MLAVLSARRLAVALAVVLALLLVAAIVVLWPNRHTNGQDATSPQARFATGIVTTNDAGFAPVVFVRHAGNLTTTPPVPCGSISVNLSTPPAGCALPMAATPNAVNANGVAPAIGSSIPAAVVVNGFSPTGFQVRVLSAGPDGLIPLRAKTVRITFRATSDPAGYCDTTVCS
jgi:hypothetical protein